MSTETPRVAASFECSTVETAGSAAEGFVSGNVADLSDNDDLGTSCRADTLPATRFLVTSVSASPPFCVKFIQLTRTGGQVARATV
jgi:hypothetical protein